MNKTIAQEMFDVKHANEMEVARRELLRRSHDMIRVYNPLDQTFSFMYDRFWHRVPAKSTKDMERYLAMKFYKNICDKIIGVQIGKKGQELIDLRIKQMGRGYTDHYEENVEVWDRTPKMNDPELMAQVFKTVIIGVVEEYGLQEEDVEQPVPDAVTDYRSVHEQMFDALTPLSAESSLPASLDELQGISQETKLSKEDLANEVLNEQNKK